MADFFGQIKGKKGKKTGYSHAGPEASAQFGSICRACALGKVEHSAFGIAHEDSGPMPNA
jgi:hypothetical protein